MNRRTRTPPKSASRLINPGACEGRRLKQRRAAIYPLAGLLSAFILSAPAQATCVRWETPRDMDFKQSNAERKNFNLVVHRSATEGEFTGEAFYVYGYSLSVGTIQRNGNVHGTIEGPNVNFTIHWETPWEPAFDGASREGAWPTNSTGVYAGTIDQLGRLQGTTHDADHPEIQATWKAIEDLRCKTLSPGSYSWGALPPPAPPPPKALGRVHLPGQTSGPNIARFETICERARAARKRNSPTAAAMEALCAEQGENPGNIVKVDTDPKQFELKPPAPLEVIPPAHLEVIPQ